MGTEYHEHCYWTRWYRHTGGYLFKIDEAVSVKGQLEPISGSTDIKTPVGGKISRVYISDGDNVRKGQLLLAYDTREASSDKITYESIID